MPWPKARPRSTETRLKIAASNLVRHADRRAKHTAYMKVWQAANPEKTAYWKLKGQQRTRRTMLEALGGRCAQCGFADWRALQVDHVNGDGASDRRRSNGSRYAYAKIVAANPDKYQLLCANCNWIKRYEHKEHGGYCGPITED